jgi:hypothetical protein
MKMNHENYYTLTLKYMKMKNEHKQEHGHHIINTNMEVKINVDIERDPGMETDMEMDTGINTDMDIANQGCSIPIVSSWLFEMISCFLSQLFLSRLSCPAPVVLSWLYCNPVSPSLSLL